MAKLRSISTVFWSDPFIEELNPFNKLLFIYLITNEKTNMLGVYEATTRKISFETGIDIKDIEKGLELFQDLRKVKRINHWIILLNFLKHQNFNPNMKKSAIDTYNSLPKELKINNLKLDRNNPLEAFETLCKAFGTVRKVELEVEGETEVKFEDEVEWKNLTADSIFPVQKLVKVYLGDKSIVPVVVRNKKNKFDSDEHLKTRMLEFEEHLLGTAEVTKTPKDFGSHFLNWHKKNNIGSSKVSKNR